MIKIGYILVVTIAFGLICWMCWKIFEWAKPDPSLGSYYSDATIELMGKELNRKLYFTPQGQRDQWYEIETGLADPVDVQICYNADLEMYINKVIATDERGVEWDATHLLQNKLSDIIIQDEM